VLGSQLVVAASGLTKALLVPVALTVPEFAYWQIYVFYVAYAGVLSFGYVDGIYLQYGGRQYGDLPSARLRASNVLYTLALLAGATLVAVYAAVQADPARAWVFWAIALNIVLSGIIGNISYTLQATNLLKEYALINTLDKLIFLAALLLLNSPSFRTFQFLIAADIASRLAVLAFLIAKRGDLLIGPLEKLWPAVSHLATLVRAGLPLLVANLSGMLILGIGRIAIEYDAGLADYAHYAFATTLANVVLISASAMSVAIYPFLRQQDPAKLLAYFDETNWIYSNLAFLLLLGYFPAVLFIQIAAPKYQDAISILDVVFVVAVLQGKMQLVNNTFYKALRLERAMLAANLSSLLMAVCLVALAWAYFHSVLALAYATLVTMLYRVYASEIYLRRQLGEAAEWRHLAEGVVLLAFLPVAAFAAPLSGFALWSLIVTAIVVASRQRLGLLLQRMRQRAA
jgi:O-antigen/teichoic acid export membrane protein